jgi:hypothetical protein
MLTHVLMRQWWWREQTYSKQQPHFWQQLYQVVCPSWRVRDASIMFAAMRLTLDSGIEFIANPWDAISQSSFAQKFGAI